MKQLYNIKTYKQYERKKTDRLLLQFQQQNGITQQTLDEWTNQHERTPY